MKNLLDLNEVKKKMLLKYPTFGSTINSVKYQIVGNNHPVTTAATDGKTIYVNSEFMEKLTEQEQVFVFAHEVCHIALNHIMRSKGKDCEVWNIATDAVINKHLQNDGLPMVDGCVNIEDALLYDAEELYEQLLLNNENQKNNEQNCDNQESQGGDGSQGNQQRKNSNHVGHDSHTLWDDAVKKEEQEISQDSDDNQNQDKEKNEVSERNVFEKNQQTKIERAEEMMSKLNEQRRGFGGESKEIRIGNIGKANKSVANWKKLLIRNLEIEDEVWGHKFSDRNNGYAARIEDVEYDENAETEIILDTSGSVSVELLRNFLKQVKTILKDSEIRVGTFSNEFHGWMEIKKEKDMNELDIFVGGGTNFDAASKAFTQRKSVNKICFTDGQDDGDACIENKRNDIIWISFENPDFKPDYGKVIFVPEYLINLKTNKDTELTL